MNLVHGEFEISLVNNIIYTNLFGTFNDQGVIAWSNALKKAINSFNGRAFSILVNELEADSATPEALSEAEQFNQ